MKKKGTQQKIASFMSLVMLLGTLFTPFGQPVYASDTDAETGEEQLIEAASENTVEDVMEEQRMSLAELAEEYSVPEDRQGESYKIIYIMEEGVSLREDWENKLSETGNESISMGEDGQVIQTFDKDSEDILAQLVYVKNGSFTRRESRWKLFYEEEEYVPPYRDSKGYWHNPDPRIVTKTLIVSANTAVKTLQQYALNGVIRVYPNWEDPGSLLHVDFHSNLEPDSVKSIEFNPSDLRFEVPGNRDERLQFKNDGFMVVSWNIVQDGSGEGTVYRHTDVDMEELLEMGSGNGKSWKLDLYAQWEKLSYDMVFDRNIEQLSAKGVQALDPGVSTNETDDIAKDYAWDETVSVNGYTTDHPGYEMLGWAFTKDAEEAVITVDGLSKLTADEVFTMKEASPVADDKESMVLYAVWGYHQYKIVYRGIKVLSANAVSENSISGNSSLTSAGNNVEDISESVFCDNALKYEILGEEETAAITKGLPLTYTIGEQLILPGPDYINEGATDPEFTDEYDFICWTKNKWMRVDVRTLGKNGDINGKDVLLYAVYSPKQMTASVNVAQSASKFKVQQINTLNLLDSRDYAVIRITDTDSHADMLSVSFDNGKTETDYYELCEVDSTKAKLGQGYATIGIKLKDSVRADKIKQAETDKKLLIRVRGVNDPEGSEQTLSIKLKTVYKIPSFRFDAKSVTIFPALTGEDGKAEFMINEKNGNFSSCLLAGKWELAYVDTSKNNIIDNVELSLTGDNSILLNASKETNVKGYIRIRNTSWIEGAYSYVSLPVKNSTKKASIVITKKIITLNNTSENEEVFVGIKTSGGMMTDALDYTLTPDKKWPEKGLTAELVKGGIRINGAKNVKKGVYIIKVSCEGMKKKLLKVKVVDTKAEKALKFKIYGKVDAVYGGQVFLKPQIKGFSGEIVSVKLTKESVALDREDPELMRYEAFWDGAYVVLSATDDFRPHTEKITETVELTLSTGQKLSTEVVLNPVKGKFKLNALNAVVSGNSVSVPLMASYTWKFYYGPKICEKRISDFDMTKPEVNDMIRIEDPGSLNKKGVYALSYDKGIITVNKEPDHKAVKSSVYKLKLPAVWSVDGKKYSAVFDLTIMPDAE